jgi:hypothetical protein
VRGWADPTHSRQPGRVVSAYRIGAARESRIEVATDNNQDLTVQRHNISAVARLRRCQRPERGHVAGMVVGVDQAGVSGQVVVDVAWPTNRDSCKGRVLSAAN